MCDNREVEVTEVIQALTEEQEKDLDEMEQAFKRTLGSQTNPSDSSDTRRFEKTLGSE